MLLSSEQRTKLDETSDTLFYEYPRFVTHVDQPFIAQLTALYAELLKPEMRILDLMSSWVSHLPSELEFAEVKGHGLNGAELAKNPRLDSFFVQNLNQNPILPLSDRYFDAVLNTVSVQYLQNPERVFAEILRVLKPGGVAVISFSNRMFYQKAIQAWRDSTDMQRLNLVKSYFQVTAGFGEPQIISNQSKSNGIWQMLQGATSNNDPFYAAIAYRNQE
jgi:SAM-dependent methyltransferase